MSRYIVVFEKIKVGLLEIDDLNRYRYTPYKSEEVNELRFRFRELNELFTSRGWGSPMPIFQSRIEDARFFAEGNLAHVKKQTDAIELYLA